MADFAMPPNPEPEAPLEGEPADGDMGDVFIVPGPDGEMPPSYPVEGDAFGADFAAPPADDAPDAFLGNVDETAPIVLGAPPEETAPETVEEEPVEPAEPVGPSPMQLWNEGWQETLKERKDAENAQKAEFLEAAQASLEEFKQQNEAKRESRMAKNRSDEQEKLEAIEADLENDNSWQRVCKMVELSHDSAEGSADVGRMKDVLITLKNDTTRAVTLGA